MTGNRSLVCVEMSIRDVNTKIGLIDVQFLRIELSTLRRSISAAISPRNWRRRIARVGCSVDGCTLELIVLFSSMNRLGYPFLSKVSSSSFLSAFWNSVLVSILIRLNRLRTMFLFTEIGAKL